MNPRTLVALSVMLWVAAAFPPVGSANHSACQANYIPSGNPETCHFECHFGNVVYIEAFVSVSSPSDYSSGTAYCQGAVASCKATTAQHPVNPKCSAFSTTRALASGEGDCIGEGRGTWAVWCWGRTPPGCHGVEAPKIDCRHLLDMLDPDLFGFEGVALGVVDGVPVGRACAAGAGCVAVTPTCASRGDVLACWI